MSGQSFDQAAREAMLTRVIEAAATLTRDWDRAFASPIAADTRLIADLGCQSLDIVVLTAQLSRDLDRRDIPFERLLMAGGKPVGDISVRMMADFLWEQTMPLVPERKAAAGQPL
jgi:acyl carrier protein